MNFTAKCIFTFLAAGTLIIPSIMDLNRTHMTNPHWPAHARFHWAVQYFGSCLLSLFVLAMLWFRNTGRDPVLDSCVAALPTLSFWTMFFPALLMPGTGTWPDGVKPPSGFPRMLIRVHPNLLLALIFTILNVIALWLNLA